MKQFKLISIAIAFVLVIGVAVYITAKVKDHQYQEVTLAQHKRFIIDKNTRIVEAENLKQLNQTQSNLIDSLNIALKEKHNEENYQKPTKDTNYYEASNVGTNASKSELDASVIAKQNADKIEMLGNTYIDNQESGVNTYIDFVPDYIPEMDTFFEDDTRVAITHYKYSDSLNKYSTTLKIKYEYKDTKFIIEPENVSFIPQKAFRYNLNILATSDKQLGAFLSYKIWRVHIGSGMLIDRDFRGVAIIGVGVEF